MTEDDPVRVLFTASRTWADPRPIEQELTQIRAQYPGRRLVLVHGGATKKPGPVTSDLLGAVIAHRLGYDTEVHYALWQRPCDLSFCAPEHRKNYRGRSGTYCPAAGIRRNLAMIRLGAQVCVAFILDESPGATHCAFEARRAGIPVRKVERSTIPRPRRAPGRGRARRPGASAAWEQQSLELEVAGG